MWNLPSAAQIGISEIIRTHTVHLEASVRWNTKPPCFTPEVSVGIDQDKVFSLFQIGGVYDNSFDFSIIMNNCYNVNDNICQIFAANCNAKFNCVSCLTAVTHHEDNTVNVYM